MRRCLQSDATDSHGEEMDGALVGVAEKLRRPAGVNFAATWGSSFAAAIPDRFLSLHLKTRDKVRWLCAGGQVFDDFAVKGIFPIRHRLDVVSLAPKHDLLKSHTVRHSLSFADKNRARDATNERLNQVAHLGR